MNYATNFAIVKNGTVTNLLKGLVYNTMDDFPNAVHTENLDVQIGDTYENGVFMRDGQVVTGSNVGVQSDWNQNDDTQPDYVKNRPFYTGDPVETVLVEESTVTFALNNGGYTADFPTSFNAEPGKTYNVSWDGTIYECVCASFQGMTAIGNVSIAGSGSDTGEPFVMIFINGNYIRIATLDTSASHTFSISQYSAGEVVKIDKRFMPEDLYGLFHFKIVVDYANSTYTADKPYADILSALKEGKPVVCGDGSGDQYLASLSGNYVHLTRVDLVFDKDTTAAFEITKVNLNESGGMSSKTYRSESILTLVGQTS